VPAVIYCSILQLQPICISLANCISSSDKKRVRETIFVTPLGSD
jgi:hypothetical protein